MSSITMIVYEPVSIVDKPVLIPSEQASFNKSVSAEEITSTTPNNEPAMSSMPMIVDEPVSIVDKTVLISLADIMTSEPDPPPEDNTILLHNL